MFSRGIVYTPGTWDLFHVGHLRLLNRCKQFGSFLIVGVSSDELVEGYKNEIPFNSYAERFEIISSIKAVDFVVRQEKLVDINQMIMLGVETLVLGDDWETSNLSGIYWIKHHIDKKVVFLPRTKGISSTSIKKELNKRSIL